jgi:hypothetical protein
MCAVKKVCINSSKNYFMGTELSPLHYGLSAEGYDINSIMEGYDKELWIVDVKNNKKVWVKNENLSRITHEEPVINNILSLYCDTEEIEKMNQLKQKYGKDGSYNLKDIKNFYNVCDDDCDDSRNNEACENETECYGADQEGKDNTNIIDRKTLGASGTQRIPCNEEKCCNISDKTSLSIGAKCIVHGNAGSGNAGSGNAGSGNAGSGNAGSGNAGSGNAGSGNAGSGNAGSGNAGSGNAGSGNAGDENYEVDVNDILKGGKSRKETSGTKRAVMKTKNIVAKATTKSEDDGMKEDDVKCVANRDDKKPTDYNIFVKFRLNELKEISTNKKDNFDNVKIEWRELKKNKGELKIVMEKAYLWLNPGK